MTPDEPGHTVPRTPPALDQTAAHHPGGDTSSPEADESPESPSRAAADLPSEPPKTRATMVRSPAGSARQVAEAQSLTTGGLPGYAILRELGRGGMGVVYEARHLKLNRIVALKTMLAGGQASKSELIRFLAEAEAVAAVKHENVVQVYDYGEADGRPFMALEFCPGGTLGKLLPKEADAAKNPREMAAIIAKVARGVAAAHALGIVHRDLKPGNVFLDSEGVPKVADFGLAKRGEGADVTQEGQGMGSPAYMAPEQARNAKFVGPQADVWALGVILYEALTGGRPFTGTVAEIMAKAQNAEPTPPRAVTPAIPRDLELICLHCLLKAPHERYPTAKELADDLDRYARHQPISVRPAGPVERAGKWVRRNKLLTGTTTAVVLALSLGLGFSLAFAQEASRQAKETEKKKKEADEQRANAIQKGDDLKVAYDDLNGSLARLMLQPMGLVANESPFPALSTPHVPFTTALTTHEQNALRELALRRGTPLSTRFLKEATQTPTARKQLASRAPFAFHAAVGLDPGLRAEANQILIVQLDRADLPAEERLSIVRAWARSDLLLPENTERVACLLREWVLESFQAAVHLTAPRQPDPHAVGDLMQVIRVMPPEAGANFLLTMMNDRTTPTLLVDLASELGVIAERLSPDMAAAICEQAVTAILTVSRSINVSGSVAQNGLAGAARALAKHLSPSRAAAVCNKVVELALKPGPGFISQQSQLASQATTVATLAPYMTPAYRVAVCQWLADRIVPAVSQYQPGAFRFDAPETADLGLSGIAAYLPRDRAADVCERVARVLVGRLTRQELDHFTHPASVSPLPVLVRYLSPEKVDELCLKPAQALAGTIVRNSAVGFSLGSSNFLASGSQTQVLLELTDCLRPEQAAQLLREVMDKIDNILVTGPLATGVAKLLPRLPPQQAEAIRTWVVGYCVNATRAQGPFQSSGVVAVAPALGALAATLPAEQAASLCDPVGVLLADAIVKANHTTFIAAGPEPLARSLVAVVPHMTQSKARTACERAVAVLVASFENAPPLTRGQLAESLGRLVVYLPPDQTPRLLDAMAEVRSSAKPGILIDRSKGQVFGTTLAAVALGMPERDYILRRQSPVLTFGALTAPPNVLASLPLMHPSFHPQPTPLPPQDLVRLLKHPFCVGEARRAVLDALEFTYKRPFKDQWDFVEYAQTHQPQLDLLTPPRLPETKP